MSTMRSPGEDLALPRLHGLNRPLPHGASESAPTPTGTCQTVTTLTAWPSFWRLKILTPLRLIRDFKGIPYLFGCGLAIALRLEPAQ